MTTDPATIARRLVDALQAWPSDPDNGAVLDACAAVRASNDPASALSRTETALADAVQRAIVLNDQGAWQDLKLELQHSNGVMRDANAAAFADWLNTMDPARLTGREIDVAAEIARDLRLARGGAQSQNGK